MKKTFSLSKILLKNLLANRSITLKKTEGWKKILSSLALLSLGLYLVFMTYFVSRSTLESLKVLDQESLFLYSSMTGISFYLVLILLVSVPSILYYAQDLETLLPLPLKPQEILMAKLLSLYFFSLGSILSLYLPLGLNYFWLIDRTFFFLLKFLFIALILPIFPLFLTSFVIVLVFSFFPKFKNKDFFTYVSSLLIFVLLFFFSYHSADNNLIESLLLSDGPVINSLQSFFFTIPDLAVFLSQGHFMSLLRALILTFFLGLLIFYLMQKIYFKGVFSSQEKTKSKSSNSKFLDSAYEKRGRLSSLILRDLKNILQTPSLALNYLLVLVILPLSLAFPFLMLLKETGFTEFQEMVNLLRESLSALKFSDLFLGLTFVSMGITFFIASMSSLASTSFSREGQHLLFLRSLPLSELDLFHSKLILSNSILIIPGLSLSLIGVLLLSLPYSSFIFVGLGSFLAANLSSLEGILMDSLAPKLVWDDEIEAVKQNFMTLIPILMSLGIMALSGFLLFKFPYRRTVLILLALLICLQVFLYLLIKRKTLKRLFLAIEAL